MRYKNSYTELEQFHGLRVAVLTAESAGGEEGGAERFYLGLLEGLISIGCLAERVPIIADESSFDSIANNYRRCSALDLSRFDVIISTKAPTFAIKHPNHVLYLVHTVRVFDDMFYETFSGEDPIRLKERATVHAWDYEAINSTKARFTIGHEVADRLYRWRGIRADVIHPPLGVTGLRKDKLGDFIFLPGRLHPWKRVQLAIQAIKNSPLPMKLIIAGTGEAENELRNLAGEDERIQFVGRLSDEQLLWHYANALAVAFVPKKEDYGYVTLEAFASSKPVVTCIDSGEPTYFVRHRETGLLCEPTPNALTEAFEWLYNNRDMAESMGEKGFQHVQKMSWASVARKLVSAGLSPVVEIAAEPLKVTITDMQPIDPPVGGGRMRLLGLYHNLGEHVNATYIGSYDWPGESYRQQKLSAGLNEIVIPLSDDHHIAAKEWSARTGGKTVIDVMFSRLGHLSLEYLSTLIDSIKESDVVVFSHPWVFPLIDPKLLNGKLIVYDAQNVEGYLRAQLFDEKNETELSIIHQVLADEYKLGQQADLILVCSHEDMLRFQRIYDFSPEKMKIVPNGVMAFGYKIPDAATREIAKKTLGIKSSQRVAIFLGSAYGPNIEAANFIVKSLAKSVPDVLFIIAGGVGTEVKKSHLDNVLITGPLNEEDKKTWLTAADLALNPMFSGSGTNIKMFDFMSMGLPTVTTKTGARGIDTGGKNVMLISEPTVKEFANSIRSLKDIGKSSEIGTAARNCVVNSYSWERISTLVGNLLNSHAKMRSQTKPFFSIVIPSYERHHQLNEVMLSLQLQIERDFEVIVIDQSSNPWTESNRSYGFPLTYYHSPIKGAVTARNTGAFLAQGRVIAFTDDDCKPSAHWLANARKYFEVTDVVGVEGIITSDHLGESDWRPVTNVGFEGIGFMTANLFVRSSVFQYVGGFDLQFDNPHFREDTDFGWRVQTLGAIPYAKEVEVFHPAQPRANERESAANRAKFFQNDALLYRKHPVRYRELFLREQHYRLTPGFKDNLLEGFKKMEATPPEWMMELLGK